MSIGKNIARYRRERHLTQEELGRMLGVSNQSVSKWESEVFYPDVMLLPEISGALGISLQELYGIESAERSERVSADSFPNFAYRSLVRLLYDRLSFRYTDIGSSDREQVARHMEKLANGCRAGCFSNTAGAVVITDRLSFIDREYKKVGGESIFGAADLRQILNDLSDARLCKVLAFEYRTAMERSKAENCSFTVAEIANACGYTEDEAAEISARLVSLQLNESYTDHQTHEKVYVFRISKALYAFCIFELAQLLADDEVWTVVRDTAVIDDYAFQFNSDNDL